LPKLLIHKQAVNISVTVQNRDIAPVDFK